MKLRIIFLLLFFLITTGFCQELVKIIPNGEANGMLRYVKGLSPSRGPYTFTISEKDIIYVVDTMNARLVLFDLELNFLRNINLWNSETRFFIDPYQIKIDNSENIYLYNNLHGLQKLDTNGVENYFIPVEELNINKLSSTLNFGLYNNYVFYFNKNQKLCVITNDGRIIDEEITSQIIDSINETVSNSFKFRNQLAETKFDSFFKKNDLLFKDDNLLIVSSNLFEMLINYFKENRADIELSQNISFYNGTLSKYKFSGIDFNNNYYWNNLWHFIVLTKYGQFITEFDSKIEGKYSIAMNGDIYIYNYDKQKDKHYFYKIPNIWDPIEPPTTTITATSYIDYQSMYTPAQAIDNNPTTAWLEGADGPGIGEGLTVNFGQPTTIDKIEISPGYFDPQWYKANNRIKRLKLILDGQIRYLNMPDVMEPKVIEFPDTKTVQKAEFVIEEVYPGTDNDTAISEIGFYYKGEKIKLGVEE